MALKVKVKQLPHGKDIPLPKYMTEHSAGMDLYAAVEKELIIPPGEWKLVPTGLTIALPDGYEAQVRPRSGLALKQGVSILNTPGTVDADYRGELQVVLANCGREPYRIERGMRFAQLIIAKVEHVEVQEVQELAESTRGMGGFGHTGH